MVDNGVQNPEDDASDTSEAFILYARSGGRPAPAEPAKPEPKNSAVRAWFAELLMSLIKTSVVFFLGFLLVKSVELDLKRAQFSADAADKLKTFVIELNSAEFQTEHEKAKATALALGGFGSVAAYPLVQLIEHGDEFQTGWGKLGLEQAGLIANDETCDVIVRVIDDPTQTFNWQTRKAVSEIAGTVACRDAVNPLKRLGAELTEAGVPIASQNEFSGVIQTALAQIERADQRVQPWWKKW